MNARQQTTESLTKRLLLLIIFGAVSIFLIKAIYGLSPARSPAPAGQERRIKTRVFTDMPVALVELRNLQSETWWKDLEVEIKNISAKPIYFVSAYLEFPDESTGGARHGIRLAWG